MSIEIKVPVLPESVVDATVATWHVQEGEQVSRDQNLVDIETDKVVLEVVAVEDGVIDKILHQEGDTVLAEQVIGLIIKGAVSQNEPKSDNVTPEKLESTSVVEKNEESALSPSVRRLLAEHNLSADHIVGTGDNQRILKEDVQKYLQNQKVEQEKSDESMLVMADRSEKRVAMTRLRKRIAERLLHAKNSTAMLTTFNEVNMGPVMSLRKKYRDLFEKTHDIRLGFMSFYVKAVVEALKKSPDINASIDGDDIIYHNYFDISIAVSTPRGLVTPVLKNADQLSFSEIEKQIKSLAEKGMQGKLTVDDLTGGNFTITNGGVFGSLMSTPIINPPQSAILGMHAIKDRPIAVNGQVEIHPMMYLALSYDHRIVDGKESVGFLVTIKDLLEDPTRLILEI